MNFLELCKKTRHESRVTGSGPSTVVNQVGILRDIVEAVNDAWLELQHFHNEWRFMERTRDVVFAQSVDAYHFGDLGISDFKSLKAIYVGGEKLSELSWDEYIALKVSDGAPQQGHVAQYTLDPSDRIVFYPRPVTATQSTIQYFSQPQRFEKNSDIPSIPDAYQGAIYWRAVMDLAANESDTVIYQKASDKYTFELDRLQSDYLPDIALGGAF